MVRSGVAETTKLHQFQTLHIFIVHTFLFLTIYYTLHYYIYIYFPPKCYTSYLSQYGTEKKVPDKLTLNPPIRAFHQTTASARCFLSPPYRLILVKKGIYERFQI